MYMDIYTCMCVCIMYYIHTYQVVFLYMFTYVFVCVSTTMYMYSAIEGVWIASSLLIQVTLMNQLSTMGNQ